MFASILSRFREDVKKIFALFKNQPQNHTDEKGDHGADRRDAPFETDGAAALRVRPLIRKPRFPHVNDVHLFALPIGSDHFEISVEFQRAEQAFQLDFLTREMEGEVFEENDEDLDLDDLELMDEDERREALEDAGYDPDDFDDVF